MIPSVKPWRVALRDRSGKLRAAVVVETINRDFARHFGSIDLRNLVGGDEYATYLRDGCRLSIGLLRRWNGRSLSR